MPRLIDVDRLKKEWHMGDICETCSRDTRQCGNDYCFSRMDVCGMLDDAPTANGWISVKDDMPKDSKPVYVWLGRGSALRGGIPFVGKYEPFREGVWQIWGLDGDKSEIIKVTHWMPIEPPEEDDEDD
jgi:hypothetical protein